MHHHLQLPHLNCSSEFYCLKICQLLCQMCRLKLSFKQQKNISVNCTFKAKEITEIISLMFKEKLWFDSYDNRLSLVLLLNLTKTSSNHWHTVKFHSSLNGWLRGQVVQHSSCHFLIIRRSWWPYKRLKVIIIPGFLVTKTTWKYYASSIPSSPVISNDNKWTALWWE